MHWGNRASYRRQDGADTASRFKMYLPVHASSRPSISLKIYNEERLGHDKHDTR